MPSTGTRNKNLKKARKRRHQIGSEFKLLETGQITVVDVLRDRTNVLGHCDIWDILRRTPKLNRDGAKKVLVASGVWPHEKLKELDEKQRATIISYLPDRVARRTFRANLRG